MESLWNRNVQEMSNEGRKFSGYLYFTRAVNTHDTYSQAADTIRGRKPKSKKKKWIKKSQSQVRLYIKEKILWKKFNFMASCNMDKCQSQPCKQSFLFEEGIWYLYFNILLYLSRNKFICCNYVKLSVKFLQSHFNMRRNSVSNVT